MRIFLISAFCLLTSGHQALAIDLTRAPTELEVSKMGAIEVCTHFEVRDTPALKKKITSEGLQCPAILKAAKRIAAKREALEKQKNKIGFKWIHENCGLNYRLTEIQSAIGRNQLRKLTQWNLAREKNALSFIKALSVSI